MVNEALIDGVELAMDYGLDIPESDVEEYYREIEKRKKITDNSLEVGD